MTGFKNVLVVVGEVDVDGPGLHFARCLTAANTNSRISVVDVNAYLDRYSEVLKDIVDKDELQKQVKRHRLDQLFRIVESQQTDAVQVGDVKVLVGTPFIEIIKEVLCGDHDLIVKNAEPDVGSLERLFGSTDMHLMRKSHVPVLILNPAQAHMPKRMLAPVDLHHPDGDDFNRRIVEMAAFAAQQFNSTLQILHVWPVQGESTLRENLYLKFEESRIEQILKEIEDNSRAKLWALVQHIHQHFALEKEPTIHLEKGDPNLLIPRFAKEYEIDLIAMGTVGRSDVPGLFIGNTAEAVLLGAECSVLTVKPVGFATPVAA